MLTDAAVSSADVAALLETIRLVPEPAISNTSDPEMHAARAVVAAERAAFHAATKTANAAHEARVARAAAVIAAAEAVAQTAARSVRAAQNHAMDSAAAVAVAADQAAVIVSQSITAGGAAEAARVAQRVGASVVAAAAAKAEETAQAAVLVAQYVDAAAAVVAATALAAAAAIEQEVTSAADAVQAVATATAQQLAAITSEHAVVRAVHTRESAVASQRLHEANRRLTQTGLHDRVVALALQEAMLTRLPEVDNLVLAARYITAAAQDQVGGDWYDVIHLADDSTTLVIGDVVGHDIQAAAIMGQLRNILRAQTLEHSSPPSKLVTRLDRANRDLRINTLATLVVVSIEAPAVDDPLSVATLRWSNAGHPAPILIQPDGSARQLDTPADLLLGVEPDGVRHDHAHAVQAGSTLLLYTDGLVETRTHSIDDGQQRLLDAIAAHHHLGPSAMLDAILTDMVGNQPSDDVAILATHFAGPPTPLLP